MNVKKYKSSALKKLLNIEESELEPYYKYYLGELKIEEMPSLQQEKLERFRKAWSWYVMGRTKEMIIKSLTKDYDIETRQAEYDLKASILIHGKKDQVDKDGRRIASQEYFDMLSQLALADKNYQVAAYTREKADTLAGVHDVEIEGLNPEDFMKPSKIVFIAKMEINNHGNTPQTIELDE